MDDVAITRFTTGSPISSNVACSSIIAVVFTIGVGFILALNSADMRNMRDSLGHRPRDGFFFG